MQATQPLHTYLNRRLIREKQNSSKWIILSAQYAKNLLLEQQRPLHEFIPLDTETWIINLIRKYSREYIIEFLDKVKTVTTITIGESIIDEYFFCDALGKVSKDPLIAFQIQEKMTNPGGVLAVARHFSGLGSETTILSEVESNSFSAVASDAELLSHSAPQLYWGELGIVKTRYIDRSSNMKVFETYQLPSNYSNQNFYEFAKKYLENYKGKSCHLVVMDYGHGLFDHSLIKLLLDTKWDITVNTQSNAGNRGLNSISRYFGAKNIFLNGAEVMFEERDSSSPLEKSVVKMGKRLKFEEVFVTNGSGGIIHWSEELGISLGPAFAPRILDRTGAGDATLAVITLLRAAKAPIDIALFYGNIAGALAVSSFGNELGLSSDLLREQAESILMKFER